MSRLMDNYRKMKAGKGKGGNDAPKLPEPAVEPGLCNSVPQAGQAPAEASARHPAAPAGKALPFQSERDMDLLAAECTERRAFETDKHVVLRGTAPILHLGTTLTRELLIQAGSVEDAGELAGITNLEGYTPYIINFAKRPKQTKGRLSLVGSESARKSHEEEVHANFYSKVFEALEHVKAYALPPGTGPFADVDGAVKAYADFLFQGAVPDNEAEALIDKIERIIDSRPIAGPRLESMEPRLFHGQRHAFNPGLETPDDPINASIILSSPSRIMKDDVSGAVLFGICHPWEPYILGVAALRSRNIPAYLGQAYVPYSVGEEIPDYLERDSLMCPMGGQAALATPVIAIIDPAADVAMRVFRLSRLFPPIGAVEILSDTAAEGAAYAMRAEMRIKHLAYEMIRRAHEGIAPLNEAEYQIALSRIARCLFQSAKRWDGNPLIPRVLSGVENGVAEGAFSLSIGLFGQRNPVELATDVADISRRLLAGMDRPELFAPQDAIQTEARDIAVFAKTAGREAAKTMQALLRAWLKKAETNREE